jgi:uncharacterized cupin superfamily protein
MPLKMLSERAGDYEEYFVAPEKLIEGNPKQQAWVEYTDPTGQLFVGTWASEPGKWNIAYTEEEYCEILEGESVITDTAGAATIVKAGDRFVIPRGFNGTWEVRVSTRKYFVIYEQQAATAGAP